MTSDTLTLAAEALRKIIDIGTVQETYRVGDAWRDDGWETTETTHPSVEIAAEAIAAITAEQSRVPPDRAELARRLESAGSWLRHNHQSVDAEAVYDAIAILRLPAREECQEMVARLTALKAERDELSASLAETEHRLTDKYQAAGVADIVAERDRLRQALERLSSSEAFHVARGIELPHDKELVMRMDFARAALATAQPAEPTT